MSDTPDSAEGTHKRRLRLYARGVFYAGEDPGTTEFSGALFDEQRNVLARHFHAKLPLVLESKRRGRPPKDERFALALVAAFNLHLCQQQADGRPPKKTLAYDSLGYSDERGARAALTAARRKVDHALPGATWELVYLPEDPLSCLGGANQPDLGGRGLWGIWFCGDGAMPRFGERWTGRGVAVYLPVGFVPRNERPAVRWIEGLNIEGG